MTRVITYGSFDRLHYGHLRLLERARALGDYLIVGVTSDDYDISRGKINLQQSLTERIEAVRETGLADLIIAEEYEGQKIDDIRRYGVDIFTIGSDWTGKFDYLKQYCQVVYLERTEGISSSALRARDRELRIGIVGDEEERIIRKYTDEFIFVNGAAVSGLCTTKADFGREFLERFPFVTSDYSRLLDSCDAIYLISHPTRHYEQIRQALEAGRHVLVESPVCLQTGQCRELFSLAEKKQVVLMEALKTAYATAYNRMLLLVRSGRIGRVVSVDATCTSLREVDPAQEGYHQIWNSMCAWGPTAMLPIFQLLGTEYRDLSVTSLFLDRKEMFDSFSQIQFLYPSAVASLKIGRGVKSEGELIVSGTKGYVFVPAPWWKTDYFEIRYENPGENRRYFYQLDGEGIRYELAAFLKAVAGGKKSVYVEQEVSEAIAGVLERYYAGGVKEIT